MSLLKPTSPELPRLEAANGQPITPVQLAALISAGPTGLPAPRPKRALHPAAVLSVWKFHIEMRPIAIHRHPSPSIAIHRSPDVWMLVDCPLVLAWGGHSPFAPLPEGSSSRSCKRRWWQAVCMYILVSPCSRMQLTSALNCSRAALPV